MPNSKKRIRILVVDDDEFIRIFLKDVFWIHAGVEGEFLMASNLKQARKIIGSSDTRPDLVFLDLRLPEDVGKAPGVEGSFRLLEELKKDPETKSIKVIIFSSFADKEIQERAFKCGANKFLIKGEYMPQEITKITQETLEENKFKS